MVNQQIKLKLLVFLDSLKSLPCICLCMKDTVFYFFLIAIASDVINVTMVITGEDCADGEYNQLWEKLSKMVTNLFTEATTVQANLIMQSSLANRQIHNGEDRLGQAERQVETQIDITRRTMRQIDTDREKNRWTGSWTDRQTDGAF